MAASDRQRLAVLLLVLVGIASVVGVLGVTAATAAETTDCRTVAVHDAYRFHDKTVQAAANDSAFSTVENTRVEVTQAPGFVRVRGENPNGYCVEVHVEMASEVVSPAELGTVTANNGSREAGWHAVRDFDRETTYTEVVFTLPAGTNATFAPSKARVMALQWTGAATTGATSLWDDVATLGGLLDDDPVKKHKYRIEPTPNTSIVTVSLVNQSSGRRISDWHATYTVPGSDADPVGQEPGAPVFYRKPSGGKVQFIFNQRNASVEFVANPSLPEEGSYRLEAYSTGFERIVDGVSSIFDSDGGWFDG